MTEFFNVLLTTCGLGCILFAGQAMFYNMFATIFKGEGSPEYKAILIFSIIFGIGIGVLKIAYKL